MTEFFDTCLKAGMTPPTMSELYHAYAMGDLVELNRLAHLFRNCQGIHNLILTTINKLEA